MGDYMRSTRECAFGQLRPELVQAIRDYLQKHELGTIEADILICCETTSEKTKRGFFRNLVGVDSDPIHYTGMLVTPGWLIWATCEAQFGVVVMAARLQDIQVMDGTTQLINDTGLEVFGFLSGFADRVSAFIGLGPEPVAERFSATVKAAAQGRG